MLMPDDASAGSSTGAPETSAGTTAPGTTSEPGTAGATSSSSTVETSATSSPATSSPATSTSLGTSTTLDPQTTSGVGSSTGFDELVLFDFWAEHCALEWFVTSNNEPEVIPCDTKNDQFGWEEKRHLAPLNVEGAEVFVQALELAPENLEGAVISGTLHDFPLTQPAEFISLVACKGGGDPCDATWQFVVRDADTLEAFVVKEGVEKPDGLIKPIYADLEPYVGETVMISLVVIANTGLAGDRLVWETPQLLAK